MSLFSFILVVFLFLVVILYEPAPKPRTFPVSLQQHALAIEAAIGDNPYKSDTWQRLVRFVPLYDGQLQKEISLPYAIESASASSCAGFLVLLCETRADMRHVVIYTELPSFASLTVHEVKGNSSRLLMDTQLLMCAREEIVFVAKECNRLLICRASKELGKCFETQILSEYAFDGSVPFPLKENPTFAVLMGLPTSIVDLSLRKEVHQFQGSLHPNLSAWTLPFSLHNQKYCWLLKQEAANAFDTRKQIRFYQFAHFAPYSPFFELTNFFRIDDAECLCATSEHMVLRRNGALQIRAIPPPIFEPLYTSQRRIESTN